jgi:hypothetical protein
MEPLEQAETQAVGLEAPEEKKQATARMEWT